MLSDTWLRTNSGKAIAKPIEKADRDGLSVRVSAKGKIVFQVRFRHDGKAARLDLGTYPMMTLKQAREALVKYKADIEQGIDPRVSKKLAKKANTEAVTVNALFELWYAAYCSESKKSHTQIKRSFEIHVFPEIGDLTVEKLSTLAWCEVIEGVMKTSPMIAVRLLSNAKQMLNWGVRRQLIAVNVLQSLTPKADFNVVRKPKTRSLSHDEIKVLWTALSSSHISPKNMIFVKLCLIYGCRNGELRLAKKSDFDFDKLVWTIPTENHKTGKRTGKSLIRPIIPETNELFLNLMRLSGSEYLIETHGSRKPLSSSASISLPYHLRQWIRSHLGVEMAHWSLHDLRRTARTNFSELAPPHVCEAALGHAFNGVWGVYDQYDYLTEQHALLTVWVERLRGLVDVF